MYAARLMREMRSRWAGGQGRSGDEKGVKEVSAGAGGSR